MGSFKGSENDQVAHFGERRSYPMMANGNIQHLFQSSRTKLQGHDKFANANKLMRCLTWLLPRLCQISGSCGSVGTVMVFSCFQCHTLGWTATFPYVSTLCPARLTSTSEIIILAYNNHKYWRALLIKLLGAGDDAIWRVWWTVSPLYSWPGMGGKLAWFEHWIHGQVRNDETKSLTIT